LTARAQDVVDYSFYRLLLVILAALIAAIVYRVVTSRLARPR
jgi:uncharacterized membrane protein